VLHRRWTLDVYLLGMFFVRVCSFSLLLSSSPRKMRRTEEGSGGRTTRNDRGRFSLTRRSPVRQEDLDTMTPIFATQDRLRQVDVGKNKRSLPANRLDLSFPYRSLLDFGLVADAGAVAWFGFSTDGETGSAGTRPDLPSGLPTGVNLFPILPSFSSQSDLYTPVLDTLRATQPSYFTGGTVIQPTSASYF
jgi:hypothetical protein